MATQTQEYRRVSTKPTDSTEQNDENVFLDNGEMVLTFGGKPHTVHALTVRQSAKWSRAVQSALRAGAKALKALQDETDPARIDAITEEAGRTAGLDGIADIVIAHGIPADVVDSGTAAEVMNAFGRLYRLENPQMTLLGKAMTAK